MQDRGRFIRCARDLRADPAPERNDGGIDTPAVVDTDRPILVDGRTIGVRCQKRLSPDGAILQFTGDDP